MQVAAVLERAQTVSQDHLGVRWPLPELAAWFNDAIRELAIHKPSAVSRFVVVELSEGTRQELDPPAFQVFEVIRNVTATSSRSVRRTERRVLDTQAPDWHDPVRTPRRQEVRQVAFVDDAPRAFYVYPGNDGTGAVEALVAELPEPIGTSGEALGDYQTVLPIPDIYANALLDYVLYRMFSKDASHAGNAERATGHYRAFATALGIKLTNEGKPRD